MLPAHLQELLTAAVDGELSSAERRIVDKLLRDSEEARAFQDELVADAQRLRGLPPAAPADDLATNVLSIIADRGMKPTPLPMPRRRQVGWNASAMLTWVSVSSAAGVLIAISIGSYLYFAASQRETANSHRDVAKTPSNPAANDPGKKQDKQPSPKVEGEQLVIELGPNPREVDPGLVLKNTPGTVELLPNPRIYEPDVNAIGVLPESEPLRVIQVRLSLLLPLKDLDQDYPRKALRDELRKDEVIHLDLFCKDGTRAVESLQAALKARGHQIVIDAVAQDRIKKKQKTEFVLFSESLSADEIAGLLEQLGADDKKAEAKKAGDGQFDKFMLAPFLAADLTELSRLLGVSAAQLRLPKLKLLSSIDPSKRLEDSTATHIAATLPKTGAPSSAAGKMTLVLPSGPVQANPQTSKEIKLFLEKRGERKPGAVPMMLVLRTIN